MGVEHLWKDIDRKTEVLWEKPISSCKGSQIPCGLGWNWTQASLVGGGQLTTWKTKMQNEYIHCLVMYCLYQWNRYVTLFKDVFKIYGLKLFLKSTGYGGLRRMNWELTATWYCTQWQLSEFINKMGTWSVFVSSLVPYLYVLWQLLFAAKYHTVYLAIASSLAGCHWCWNLFIYFCTEYEFLSCMLCTVPVSYLCVMS